MKSVSSQIRERIRNGIKGMGVAFVVLALLGVACGAPTESEVEPAADETGDEAGTAIADDTPAETKTFSVAMLLGPNSPRSDVLDWWASEVRERTGGALEFDITYGAALLPLPETLQGVGGGRANLGVMVNAYTPAELPLSQVVGVPFVTSNMIAQERAFMRLKETYDPFADEYRDQGVELLYWFGVEPNTIGCTNPIDGIDQLEGRSIRAIGYSLQALDAIGADPVGVSATEIYESLQRGVLDCYSGLPFTTPLDFGMHEVVDSVIEPGLGSYAGMQLVMNLEDYEGLTEDQRQVIDEVSGELTAEHLDRLSGAFEEACDLWKEQDVSLTIISDAETQRWRDLAGEEIIDRFIGDAEDAGAPGEEFFGEYEEAVAELEAEYPFESAFARCLEGS